ncbi:MAG: 2-phospho-L-lactate transferase [Chloroflexi bacterium]|nr:2-phospho-L-lactate transferase [Chloroflexota bacterium]
MITVLAGGVGAAKFLQGLVKIVDPSEVTVIVNTGDDVELHGLYISPDVDTVTYTLAGLADEARGWGLRDETWECLAALKRLGHETWFNLGDRDMGLHIHRTQRLRDGATLSEVAAEVASALGVGCRILPMSDQRVETRIKTRDGDLGFQEYLVKRGAGDPVQAIDFAGIEDARPADGVTSAIEEAQGIVIAPSNPLISIGPILAVKGIREALAGCKAPVVAVSPIVGGKAIKGPAADMMQALGLEVSAYQVAELYRDFLDAFILDYADADSLERVRGLGIKAIATDTIMKALPQKMALARSALRALGVESK